MRNFIFVAVTWCALSLTSVDLAEPDTRQGILPRVPPSLHKSPINPRLLSFMKETMPRLDFKLIREANNHRFDMPMVDCEGSMECHQRFTNYLGSLLRMMDTGKRK